MLGEYLRRGDETGRPDGQAPGVLLLGQTADVGGSISCQALSANSLPAGREVCDTPDVPRSSARAWFRRREPLSSTAARIAARTSATGCSPGVGIASSGRGRCEQGVQGFVPDWGTSLRRSHGKSGMSSSETPWPVRALQPPPRYSPVVTDMTAMTEQAAV